MPSPTQENIQQLQAFIQPWHAAAANPAQAQEKVLVSLLSIYTQTEEGRQRKAGRIGAIQDYQHSYPVRSYAEYSPLLDRVMRGETNLLLTEEPAAWAMSPGAQPGEPKFIPITSIDARMRASAVRAAVNFATSTWQFKLLTGVNLNLSSPSVVGKVVHGNRAGFTGDSPEIYSRQVPASIPIRSVPVQEEIDALGGGNSLPDREARFDLVYQRCQGKDVTMVGGSALAALDFGRYLRRKHGVFPKDVWQPELMTLGGTPGIQTRLGRALRSLYGPTAIREIYAAAEGVFGQQMDDRGAWVPNYDLVFFEVKTRGGIKQLHQMRPGEIGSLIVSTSVLARYRMGDLILAMQPPYFRCIGREAWWTPLRYGWEELRSLNLGRL